MAQVPNYYYNSPALADIGRNLASALQPVDPDKLREREQNQFEFDYLKTKAGNEATDREGAEKSRVALGDMYGLRDHPILGADGKIDKAATERKAYELADIAMTYGPKDVRADVDAALFEASPSFRRKQIVQKAVAAAAAQRVAMMQGGLMDRVYAQGGVDSALQAQKDAEAMARLQLGIAGKLKELQITGDAAAKAAGLKPITITPALVDEIGAQIRKHEKTTGHELTDVERLSFVGEATARLQTLRDPVMAVNQIWSGHFGSLGGTDTPTREEPDLNSWINWMLKMLEDNPEDSRMYQDHTVLDPQAPAPPAATGLGGAVTTPPVTGAPGERDMELLTRARAEVETENLRNKVKPQPGGAKPAGKPVLTPAQKRAALEAILGK